jgi:hypothetical protein
MQDRVGEKAVGQRGEAATSVGKKPVGVERLPKRDVRE